MKLNSKDKTALILGAGGGIGSAIVKNFIENDYHITACVRNTALIQNQLKGVNYVDVDLIDENSIKKVFESHILVFNSSPDVVINAAGVQGDISPLWEGDSDSWINTIQSNLVGPFFISKHSIKNSIQYKRPVSIIMFAGGGATYARPNFSAYAVSKTGVLRLVETLFKELELNGLNSSIQINAIAPGAVDTAMTNKIIKAGVDKSGEEAIKEAMDVKEGKGCPPDMAAKLCIFLASSESNGINGRLIHVRENYKKYAKNADTINTSSMGLLRRVDYDL
jgi:NAD(P)-dependent dehydrogenase (short-subunit alcohol dehydrogenase family)